jgi:flavin reductase (DIM6/NTAB) family NADH-FMN oxidoreductase RutF
MESIPSGCCGGPEWCNANDCTTGATHVCAPIDFCLEQDNAATWGDSLAAASISVQNLRAMLTTGKAPVPELKARQFHTETHKFEVSGLSHVAECPFQLEARVLAIHPMGGEKLQQLGGGVVAVVEILRVHAREEFIETGTDHVDPDKWSPLVYNFRHYYELSDHELGKTFRA